MFAICCHSNETRAPIANLPNSAQLWGTCYHSPSYIRVRAVVWKCSERQKNTHYASSTTHTKCNNLKWLSLYLMQAFSHPTTEQDLTETAANGADNFTQHHYQQCTINLTKFSSEFSICDSQAILITYHQVPVPNTRHENLSIICLS